jgi:plastocyanin
MSITTQPAADAQPAERRNSWRDVVIGVGVGNLILAAAMLLVAIGLQGTVDAFPFVIAGVVGVGVLLARRPGRTGVIYLGVTSVLLFLGFFAFGGLNAAAHPQSTFDFILIVGLLVNNLTGLAAFPGALVALGVVSGLLASSDPRLPGDLGLRAKDFEFDADTLQAKAGRVAVYVKNDDPTHHDFTIQGVVKEEVPGGKARRAVFDIEAGTYRFYCTLHPDAMQGALKVS